MIHFLSFNIWYVIYVVFWIKYWNLKLPHHYTFCFYSQFVQCPNFFGIGFVYIVVHFERVLHQWQFCTFFFIPESVYHFSFHNILFRPNKYSHPWIYTIAIVNLETESENKKDRAFKSSFNARHNSGSLMPAIYSIMYIYIQRDHNFEISAFTPTYTTMARIIAETSEDDTSIFKQNPTWINCVNQSKINATHLSKGNNLLKQPRHQIRALPAPWVLSTAWKFLIGYNLSVFWDSVRHCRQKRFSKIT